LYTELIKAGLLLVGVALIAIVTFWQKILDWVTASLTPWLNKYLPSISEKVKDAFAWIDNAVAVPIRRIVKKAWEELRNYLLKVLVQFERQMQSEWVKRITSFIIEKLDGAKPIVKKIVTEEQANWDDLPEDVRAAWLKNGSSNSELDVTGTRDRQIDELIMTN
jgi:hypothetical protein